MYIEIGRTPQCKGVVMKMSLRTQKIFGICLAIGAVVGLVIGLVLRNIGDGLLFGLVVGFLAGLFFSGNWSKF
jgi:hypothetical protein